MRAGLTAAVLVIGLGASGCAGVPDTTTTPGTSAPAVTTTAEPSQPASAPVPTDSGPPSWSAVFESSEPAVVRVSAVTCEGDGWTGTAFAVDDRVVVTAAHVAQDARTMSIQTTDGTTVGAEPVGIFPDTDVAVLRLEEPLSATALALAEAVPERGSDLAVLGYPFGTFALRIVNGIVVGLPESVDYPGQHVERAFITNAATNSGNSGGPVVDHYGKVIGLLSGGKNWDDNDDPVEGVNFVVPIDDVRAGLDTTAGATRSLAKDCDDDAEPAPGEVEVSLTVDDDDPLANAVGQVLYTHGLSINDGSYASAFALFTRRAQRNLGGLEGWSDGVEESYWRAIDVMDARTRDGGDRATARVALQTEQPPGDDVTDCSIWILDYDFAVVDGQLLIDKVRGKRPTAC